MTHLQEGALAFMTLEEEKGQETGGQEKVEETIVVRLRASCSGFSVLLHSSFCLCL
jgi:hypothetical protein